MPTYEIKAPNGKTYQIEGPPGASQEDVIRAVLAQDPSAGVAPPARRDASLLGEIQKAGERMFVGAGTAISGLGSEQDAATAGVEALRRQQELEKKYGESPSLARVMETYRERGLFPAAGQAVSDLPSFVAQQVPNLAAMYGGAKLGAVVGAPLGGPVGASIGATIGGIATLLPTFAGENIAAQAREDLEQGRPVEIDRAKAYGTAAGQSATEVLGTVFALGSRAVRSILKLPAETPLANKGLEELLKELSAKTLAKGAVRGAAVEMPVELAQSVLQRWQAGQDLLSDDALMDYGESLYGALMVGAPLGTLGRYTERSQLQGLIGEKQKEEDLVRQEQRDAEIKAEQEDRQLLFRSKIDDLTRPQLEEIRDRLAALPERAKSVDKRLASIEAALTQMPAVEEGQGTLPGMLPTFGQVQVAAKAAEKAQAEEAKLRKKEAKTAKGLPEEEQLELGLPVQFGPTDKIDRSILQAAGLPLTPKNEAQTSLLSWFNQNIVGKTQEDLIKLKEEKPGLFKGKSLKARVLNELLTPETAAPIQTTTPMPETETPAATTTVPTTVPTTTTTTPQTEVPSAQPSVAPQTVAGGTEPSVGVSGERGTLPTGESTAPDAGGVVSPSVLTEQRDGDETVPPTAVTTPTPEPVGYEGYAPQGRAKQLEVLAGDINASDETKFNPKAKPGTRLKYISFGAPDVNGPGLGGDAGEAFYDSLTLAEKLQVEENVAKLRKMALPYARRVKSELDRGTRETTESPAPKDMTLEGVLEEVKAEEKQAAKAAKKEVKEVEKLVGEVETEAPKLKAREQTKQEERKAKLSPKERAKRDVKEQVELEAAKERQARAAETQETPTGRKVTGKRYSQQPSAAPALTESVQSALGANDLPTALARLAETTKNPVHKRVAERLAPLLKGTKIQIRDELSTSDGVPALGAATADGREIYLRRKGGLNEETLLHEAIHAASERVLAMPGAKRTAAQNVAVDQLKNLWNTARSADLPMSAEAKKSLSEFLSEALSNVRLQNALAAQSINNRSLWARLKDSVLRLLNLSDPRTQLDAVFDAATVVFRGPETSATLSKDEIRYMLAPVRAGAGARTVNESLAKDTPDKFTKARFYFADKAAPLFEKMGAYMNGVVRDAMGDPSVELMYRQGEAADQFVPEFLRRGSARFNRRLGVWEAYSEDGVPAPVKLIEKVRLWGESKGLKFDAAWEKAAKLLQAARENEFRKANAANAGNPNARKFPITLSNEEFARLFDEYSNDADIKALNELMDKPRLALIDNLAAVGRISPELAEEWKAATAYVPFDRLEEFGEQLARLRPQKSVGRGLTALGKLPELVDAMRVDRPVKNVLENYFNTMGWMMQEVLKTDALNRTLDAMTKMDVPRAKFMGYTSRPSLRNAGLEVAGYKKGKKVYYQVATTYDAAAFNVQVAPMPKFVSIMQQFSNVLRTTITAIPTFTANQLPQDIQRAIMFSGVKDPVALAARVLANMKTYGKAAVLGKLYEVTGNLGRTGVVGDVDFRSRNPGQALLEELGLKDRTMLKSKKFGEFVHRLTEIARASDAAVRQAIYDQTMKETGDEALALGRAREIINFRSYGAGDPLGMWHFMVQTIPFMNAYAQGTDVLARSLTGKGGPSGQARKAALNMFWQKAGYLMAANSIYALAMAGDEEYEDTDLEKRDKMYMIGSKDGVGYGIPVASEIGMLFKAIPERVIEAMRKQGTPEEKLGTEAVLTWFKAAFNEYAGRITPIPAATKPALEALTNFSFRTFRPLEGIGLKELDPSQRVTYRTTELAKHIADWTRDNIGVEVSPNLIDNTINSYFGTSAAFMLMVGDQILNPNRTDRPLYQMVGLTPFTYSPVGTRYISEFYDLRDKIVRSQNSLNRLVSTGDMEGAQRYYETNKERLAMYSSVNSLLNQLQKTRAYKSYLDSKAGQAELPSDERLRRKQEVEKYEQEQSKALLLAREMLKP